MATSLPPAKKITFKKPSPLQPSTVKTLSGSLDTSLADATERISYTISYPGNGAAINNKAKTIADALSSAMKKLPQAKGK